MKAGFSTLLELVGIALVAFGFGLRWFWVGIVVAGLGLVTVGFLLGLPTSPSELVRRDE